MDKNNGMPAHKFGPFGSFKLQKLIIGFVPAVGQRNIQSMTITTEDSNMEIEIGKFTLESLTTGMYSEPESCYREYIQNAVDSLDTALDAGIMQMQDFRIEIIVDDSKQEISIKDNGTGIKKELVRKTLLDIGNSTKLHTTNRGFRGIGRLGGLSYCKKLSFCTTVLNENEKTLLTFDCEKLKALLVPGQSSEYNLQSVIEAVTEVRIMQEQASAHYFIVKMEGVDDISSLLDLDTVKDYISQVAPIPFMDRFYWGKQIKEKLSENRISIAEYPVFLGESFEALSQVYKPYKNSFEANSRAGVAKDEVNGLSFFSINNSNQKLMAYGWYADTDFSGTLVDDSLSGVRLRQGNILIGNQGTLAPYYKEHRFNGWAIGEVYVVSPELIPNARRDNFEKNSAFSDFIIGLRDTIGTDITDKIRAASKVRNNPIQKTLKKVKRDVAKVEEVLSTGFHSSAEKEQVVAGLTTTRRDLYTIPKNAPSDFVDQKIALMERLTLLVTEVDESTNFRVKKDIPSNFSKAEKKVLQAMMEVLTRNFERATVDSLYHEFLEELRAGGKK
jgi:molecular chaperone HtpG